MYMLQEIHVLIFYVYISVRIHMLIERVHQSYSKYWAKIATYYTNNF